MNSDIFAHWMLRQGYKVIRTDSTYWAEASFGVYQAFPFHLIISPTDEELNRLLINEKGIALRYSTPMDASLGSFSYHVVYEQSKYSQIDLPKKARHDIKKGLSISRVERIPLGRLSTEGWDLRYATLARQGRLRSEKQSWWQKLCRSAEGLPGFEAWGVLVEGKMVASLLGFICDDYFSILYQQSLTDYLHFGVNNALTYVVTSDVLSRPEPKRIFYGLHSLDAPSGVDKFKFRMGYSAKQIKQRVEFNPHLRPVINLTTHRILRLGVRMFPENHLISKAEGIIRFFLKGKRQTHQNMLNSSIFPDTHIDKL